MSKAVAEKKETINEIVTFDASIFEQDAGMGMGDLSQDDMAIPFLKVLSRQDPVLDDLDDAKAGDILNTVSNQVYAGKTGIRVIPCAYQRRYLEWAPRGSGNGAPLNIYTPEDKRPRTERGDDNKDYVVGSQGTYIDETHQHYVLILNEDGTTTTAVIAMKSTQMKKSRKWNSTIAQRTLMGKNGPFTPPRFSHVYLLKTVSEENSKGSWHGWDISLEGVVEDGAQYQQAKAFADSIMKGDVEAKHTAEGDDTSDDAPF
jgi:hypothetical protein